MSEQSTALVLKNFSGLPEITARAMHLKLEAIEAARHVATVTTADEQQVAILALRKLKDVRSELEASRKAVKKPVLDLGRRIDAIATEFGEEVERQYGRLSGMINHYQ